MSVQAAPRSATATASAPSPAAPAAAAAPMTLRSLVVVPTSSGDAGRPESPASRVDLSPTPSLFKEVSLSLSSSSSLPSSPPSYLDVARRPPLTRPASPAVTRPASPAVVVVTAGRPASPAAPSGRPAPPSAARCGAPAARPPSASPSASQASLCGAPAARPPSSPTRQRSRAPRRRAKAPPPASIFKGVLGAAPTPPPAAPAAPAAAAAVPPPVAARQPAQDGDWQPGRRRRRRRPRQRRPGASVKPSSPETRTGIPPELQDRCLNCLSSAHRIATCRLPVRCRRCMGLNHLARDCKRPRSPSSPSERQGGRRVLPRRAASPSDATPSASQASTPVGSPVAALAPSPPPLCFSASPIRSEDESLCVVERSPQLIEEEGRLRRALFARVSGLDMALSAGDAAAALSAALHLPAGRFSVHCAQPDHFLIVFANSGDRDLALSRSPIPAPPYQLILRPWTRLVTATSFSMPFRVSLDLEGVPAHAWNASTAAALVAPGRLISVDTPARPDEYRFLRVTISSHNPAAIPKARLLLIPEPTLGSQCLLRYRVLLHVRSVVCLSAPSASGDVDPAGGGGASGEGGGAANDGGGDLGARSSRGLDGGSRRDGSRRDGAPQQRSSGVLGGVRLAEVAGAEARGGVPGGVCQRGGAVPSAASVSSCGAHHSNGFT